MCSSLALATTQTNDLNRKRNDGSNFFSEGVDGVKSQTHDESD